MKEGSHGGHFEPRVVTFIYGQRKNQSFDMESVFNGSNVQSLAVILKTSYDPTRLVLHGIMATNGTEPAN